MSHTLNFDMSYKKSWVVLEKTICRFLDSAATKTTTLQNQAGTKAA